MAAIRPVRVMISSRNADPIRFGGKAATLSQVRLRLKEVIEAERLFGQPVFEVWINEDGLPGEGTEDAWEHCMRQVQDADIVLALYDGNAGWARADGETGICHGELEAVLATAPAKLRLIRIEPLVDGESEARDLRFRRYVERQSRFWATVTDGDELLDVCQRTLAGAVTDMVRLGVREARKGKYYSGAALDWSRLDFERRRAEMEGILRSALAQRPGSRQMGGGVVVELAGEAVALVCHAVPAALTVAAARELVGRPHLRDHQLLAEMGDATGPVHVIACHRNVTERQALDMLGFPDAVLVTPPFGVYVADDVQKVQLVFIRDCRDETATRTGAQRFLEWLEQTAEDERMVARAAGRRRIISVIAEELEAARDGSHP